jgi:hypothetical protein
MAGLRGTDDQDNLSWFFTKRCGSLPSGTTGAQRVPALGRRGGEDVRIVLAASSALAVGDGVTVSVETGGFGTVANLGSGATSVGVKANVGNLLSQGPVTLRNNAVVQGSITDGSGVTEQQGAVVKGTFTQQPVATDASRQIQVTFPATAPSLTLAPGASQSLAPGAFGNVVANARASLSLTTGTYTFASLDIEAAANLKLDETAGPVVIYVQNVLLYKGNEVQTGGDASVFIGVFGTQTVALQAPYRGTVVAPNATLELTTQSAGFAGAFFGSTVQVDPNTTITGIGAVIPGGASIGVSPTLNCVAQLSATQWAAVFGYVNTTGSNVTLGVGPHNLVTPGPADQGQPILFVPGTVPIAALSLFAPGGHTSLTLGQQSVIASTSSPACPTGLVAGLQTMVLPSSDSQALVQSSMAVLANPNASTFFNGLRNEFALTPFQSSLFDAVQLAIQNVDILKTPFSSLSPSQLARVPAFSQAFQANPAVLALRMAGDQARGSLATEQCDLAQIVTGRGLFERAAPPTDSMLGQFVSLTQSTPFQNMAATVGNVVANAQQAPALQALPGIEFAGALPASLLNGINLPGPIPTGSKVDHDIVGVTEIAIGVVGAAGSVVAAVAGCVGTAGTACAPGIALAVGGVTVGIDLIATGVENVADTCGDKGSPVPTCGLGLDVSRVGCTGGSICRSGCCIATENASTTSGPLTAGTTCANGATVCFSDDACLAGSECLNGCCGPLPTIACGPGTPSCTFDTDCSSGTTCQFGCCAGPCGVNGIACDSVTLPACGTANTCPTDAECTNGCCQFIVK